MYNRRKTVYVGGYSVTSHFRGIKHLKVWNFARLYGKSVHRWINGKKAWVM